MGQGENAQIGDLLPAIRGGFSTNAVLYSSRCKICTSAEEILLMVNRLLISGAGYAEIVRTVRPISNAMGIEIKYPVVRKHALEHFDFKSKAIREIFERRQAAVEGQFNEGKQNIVKSATVYETIMRKGLDQALDPLTNITVSETIMAAKLLDEIEKDDMGSLEASQAQADLAMIIEVVQEVCEQWQLEKISEMISQRKNASLAGHEEILIEEEEIHEIVGTD